MSERKVPCNECNGEGGFDGVEGGACSECGGTGINALNLARASTPPDANTSWFCVPCGFTTKDAAEAQAHLGPHMIELKCPFDGQVWRFHTQEQADMLQKHLDWHAAQKEGGQ